MSLLRRSSQKRPQRAELISVAATRSDLELAWSLLLDTLGDVLAVATVDAYPAPEWDAGWDELPEPAQQAQRELRHFSSGGSDRGMGLRLDMHDRSQARLVRDFGLWSIHCEIEDDHGETRVESHDEGGPPWASVTGTEAARLGLACIQHDRRMEEIFKDFPG